MDHLFTCLGRRSKWDKKSSDVSLSKPKGECEKERDVEASDPPARFPFKFDLGSRDASQLNSTTRSSNEGKSTCKVDAISKRPAPNSFIHSVGPDHDSASPNRERSEPVFTALHNSLQSRLRSPPPAYTPSKHVSVRTHSDLSRKGYRPQAVPIALPDDPASRERREAALRARGLLPPRQPRDLLAKETDTNADRPIDGLKKNDSLFSGPDKVHSDADEIARSWRIKNSIWLSDTVPKSNSPGSSTTEGASPLSVAHQDQVGPFQRFYLFPTRSDTFSASPTAPTPVCYSSSESEDSLETTNNGELIDSSASPAVKNVEGSFCQEAIAEGPGPRLDDDDDTDTLHNSPGPLVFTVTSCSTGGDCETAPRRQPAALLSGLKSKGPTTRSTPPSALSNLKSASMLNLHHPVSGSSFFRSRARSTVSRATPRSSAPLPLAVKMYDCLELRSEVSGILDDEARRLCELSFLK